MYNHSYLSLKEWIRIYEDDIESSDVVDYFYSEQMKIRIFPDVLRKFAPEKDDKEIKELLRKKLCEFDSALKSDSIRKNIGNWFSGKEPDNKKTLIKICFALGLNEEEAQLFMKFTQESGFHLRDPEDAAFLYCLRDGKNYQDAEEFVRKFPMPPKPDRILEENSNIVYTKIVADAFSDVYSDGEFEQFYKENVEYFDELRNTAHRHFTEYLDLLINAPVPEGPDEEASLSYSIEKVVEKYLRMRLPSERETSKYDEIQKFIRKNWPNETEVKEMRNRVKGVTRKALLLSYIATESVKSYSYCEDDDEENLYDDDETSTPLNLLEKHRISIDIMLDECGFARLDPRNPFDWLIMYCLKTDEAEKDGIAGKLQEVVSILFQDDAEPEDQA